MPEQIKSVNAVKGNYHLDKIELLNVVDGKAHTFDISGYVAEIEFTESIYENAIHGSISMVDSAGLPQYFPLTGQEYLIHTFKTGDDAKTYQKIFRVYKNEDIKRAVNVSTGTYYTLSFASEEFILNEKARVYRAYKNQLTSDIVSDIFNSYLKSASTQKFSKNLDIDSTSQAQQIVIPSLKPLQAINMLTSFAQAASSDFGFFLFFENANGFNFKNIETLYRADSKAEYTVTPDNTDQSGVTQPENKVDSVFIPMEVVTRKGFNILDELSRGMFSNTVEGVDMFSKQSTVETYDYDSQFKNSIHVEPSKAFPLVSNQTTEDLSFSTSQIYKSVSSRSLRLNSNYFKNHDTDGVSFSKTYERYLPARTSVYLQANAVEVVMVVSGNTDLMAGDIITLNLDNRTAFSNAKTEPTLHYLSGRFLIKSLTHIVKGKYFNTKLVLTKDCFTSPIINEPSFNTAAPA